MAKEKFYTLWGKATDSNGVDHYVTVVGKFTQEKVDEDMSSTCKIATENGKEYDAVLLYSKKAKLKSFVMARSICDPRDTFDENVGIEIAKKRINRGGKHDIIGSLNSLDLTMLNDDMCNILVFNELAYTIKHIDDYLKINK